MKNATKSTVTKTTVKKASPSKEAYAKLNAELKTLSATKKSKKAELLKAVDGLWKQYQTWTKTEYRKQRSELIEKFNAVKAERKAKRAEKVAAKPQKKAVKKIVEKTEATAPAEVTETK